MSIYDVTTDTDAYTRGYLNGTLVVTKHHSPKNSEHPIYFNVSDDYGIISTWYYIDEMTEFLVSIAEHCQSHYVCEGDFMSQVTYDWEEEDCDG